jgi:hypothetical protein
MEENSHGMRITPEFLEFSAGISLLNDGFAFSHG